ncbi:hypothetical protein HZS_4924 [Henneguya salminicola]|nr:hypothetical protein HZS_4924 [Henneguya salminicola]
MAHALKLIRSLKIKMDNIAEKIQPNRLNNSELNIDDSVTRTGSALERYNRRLKEDFSPSHQIF